MSLGDGAARLLVTESVEQAHALRRREDEVEPGNGGELLGLDAALVSERVDALDRDHAGLSLATCAQLLLGVRMEATDQPAELALVHDAFEPERLCAPTDPDAGRLATTGVVVVETCCDGAFVVALLTRRELRDAQHDGHYSTSTHLWVE